MKRIYSSPHLIEVHQLKNLLERRGIECFVQNESSYGFHPEGAIHGDVPELWIADESTFARAMELKAEWLS
jgi:hypothetical protein